MTELEACPAPRSKGRPCVTRDTDDRCLWCNRLRPPAAPRTHCAQCGLSLCTREELGQVVDSAVHQLNALRPTELLNGAPVEAAALAGGLAVVAFELLRIASLLRLCKSCSGLELQRAASERLKRIVKA